MQVLVYEWTTSGGLLGATLGADTAASLGREGQAMLRAVVDDLCRIDHVEPVVMLDCRYAPPLPSAVRVVRVESPERERRLLVELARSCDATLLIAPECEGHLVHRAQWVEQAGGRLLGPSAVWIELASDKHATCQRLAAHGIPVPVGYQVGGTGVSPVQGATGVSSTSEQSRDQGSTARLSASAQPMVPGGTGGLSARVVGDGGSLTHPAHWLTSSQCHPPLPFIVKPLDGAGSLGVRRVDDEQQARELANLPYPMRCEQFCPGTPVSVALLCGPHNRVALPPCRQRLADDGRFTYLGGELPLPGKLSTRATDLACRALDAMPPTIGYVGIDLVLGADPGGDDDVVIEINPRLTTSYVGLRAACRDNLAAAMLAVAAGQPTDSTCEPIRVEFDADGTVRRQERPA